MTTLAEDIDKHPVAEAGLAERVPVIDISALGEDSGDDSVESDTTVSEIATACRDWGFFQVINHGISDQLINDLWFQSKWFFSQPAQVKQAILRDRENPWGYYNNELTKNQRDRKEVFDFTVPGVDPIYQGQNRWPARANSFTNTMLDYLDACAGLSLRLLGAFCSGLGVAHDHLHEDFSEVHTGFVRLNYYPVADPLENSAVEHLATADLGVHHHTDAGALTVLLQDDTGGLQVYRDGFWHDIPPVDGALVINTGDMMQVWSNDVYRAAMHRVLAMSEQDRYSVPFFFNPPASANIQPLPGAGRDHAHYDTINWAEYRGRRTDGDYADYGTEVQISQFRKHQ